MTALHTQFALSPSDKAILDLALACDFEINAISDKTGISPIDFIDWSAQPHIQAVLDHHLASAQQSVNEALARAMPDAIACLARTRADALKRRAAAPPINRDARPVSNTPSLDDLLRQCTRLLNDSADDDDTAFVHWLEDDDDLDEAEDEAQDEADDEWLDRWIDGEDLEEGELSDEDLLNPTILRDLAARHAPQLLNDESFLAATQPDIRSHSESDKLDVPVFKSEILKSEIASSTPASSACSAANSDPATPMNTPGCEFDTPAFKSEIRQSEISPPPSARPAANFDLVSIEPLGCEFAHDHEAPRSLPVSERLCNSPPPLWFSESQLSELLETSRQNIAKRIARIYKSGELLPAATCKSELQVAFEGPRPVHRHVKHYSLDLALAVATRVNTAAAERFRAAHKDRAKSNSGSEAPKRSVE